MPKANQIREAITQRIAEALKNGVTTAPRCPWSSDPNCGAPMNIISKRKYRGVNPILLGQDDRISRWYGTYRQWKELGGHVRRGESGTNIIFYMAGEEETNDPLAQLGQYPVFNIKQVDGDKLDAYRPASNAQNLPPDDAFSIADRVIKATGADIRFGGNEAFYAHPTGPAWPDHTGGDFIRCPHRQQFSDTRKRYETLLHELAHWAEVRMDWNGSYAMAEIIAELTTCYLSSELRLPQSEERGRHESYLQSWLLAMDYDSNWIFKAAKQADRVADFLLSFSRNSKPLTSTSDAA